jgi:hypothetical protein
MAAAVERFATPSQKADFLPRLATGDLRGGVALTERLYRDAPLLVIAEGTNELQRIIIARQLIERNPVYSLLLGVSVMAPLATLKCLKCGNTLSPVAGVPKRPNSFADLLRRCNSCGIGYSNAGENPVLIYRDAQENVPSEVCSGLDSVLRSSLNVRNRKQKRFKFGSYNSEDAVTWTVFSYLGRNQPKVLQVLGKRWLGANIIPSVLFLGCSCS